MSEAPDCIFCKIRDGAAPCFKVYEDGETLAFMDIMPQARGHALVVSKEHAADLFALSAEAAAACARTVKIVAHALRKVVSPQGVMIAQLNGRAAGQTVFHYHVHIIPRQEGEPLALHAAKPGNMEEIKALGARIAAEVEPVA